jgi:hypothetical protein
MLVFQFELVLTGNLKGGNVHRGTRTRTFDVRGDDHTWWGKPRGPHTKAVFGIVPCGILKVGGGIEPPSEAVGDGSADNLAVPPPTPPAPAPLRWTSPDITSTCFDRKLSTDNTEWPVRLRGAFRPGWGKSPHWGLAHLRSCNINGMCSGLYVRLIEGFEGFCCENEKCLSGYELQSAACMDGTLLDVGFGTGIQGGGVGSSILTYVVHVRILLVQ